MRTAKARQATAAAKAGKPVETTFDLPREIDQALVAQGYKGKLGAFALNTLLHRVSVLSKAHQVRDLDNPCSHPGVRELLSNVRRGHADRGVRTKKQTALTKAPFEAVLDTCADTPRGVRDRALLLFAWSSGGRRRSEVTSAVMANLEDKGFEDGFDYPLLHRASRLFEHLARLEAVLGQFPEVDIVVSSSWRVGRNLDQLREPFAIGTR